MKNPSLNVNYSPVSGLAGMVVVAMLPTDRGMLLPLALALFPHLPGRVLLQVLQRGQLLVREGEKAVWG